MDTREKWILIVDDDPGMLEVLTAALERPGRRIETAHNRRTAEELAAKKRYDLVISDVFLPDTRQLELVDRLKEIDLDYRIILISGYLGDGNEDPGSDEAFTADTLLMAADRKGVFATLKKPFHLERLEATVARALEA